MSQETDHISSGMSAETGYDLSDEVAPLRISGFIGLICGVISVFSIIAMPMLGFALAAIIFGFLALRRSDSEHPPIGVTPARIGILLAVLFGSCGIARPLTKTAIIGGQAEQFAREYVKLLSSGEVYYAMELNKEHFNRYLDTMPLDKYYSRNEQAVQAATEFRDASLVSTLESIGPDAEWRIDQPTRVYNHYGRNLAQVVLATDRENAAAPVRIRVILEYRFNQEDGALEWQIDACVNYRERIVAESIL